MAGAGLGAAVVCGAGFGEAAAGIPGTATPGAPGTPVVPPRGFRPR